MTTRTDLPACPPIGLEAPEERATAPHPTKYAIIDTDAAICREVIRILGADDRAVLITPKKQKRKLAK